MISVCIFYSKSANEFEIREKYDFLGEHFRDVIKLFYIRSDQNVIIPDDLEGAIIHPATGGTERSMLSFLRISNIPIMIIAKHSDASFPAALEVYAHVKDGQSVIFHSFSFEDDAHLKYVKNFVTVCKALKKINQFNLGVIGGISEKVVTADNFKLNERIYPHFKRFHLGQIEDVSKKILEEDVNKLDISSYDVSKLSKEYIFESKKTYLVLKKIITENNLQGIISHSDSYFGESYNSCYALSLLNSEDVFASTEGDLPAFMSLVISSMLSKLTCWMAKPVNINYNDNIATFTHSFAPVNFYNEEEKYLIPYKGTFSKITSLGKINPGKATLMRIDPESQRMIIAQGEICNVKEKDETHYPTQVDFKFYGDVNKWINSTFGKNHIICYDDNSGILKDFCILTKMKYLRI